MSHMKRHLEEKLDFEEFFKVYMKNWRREYAESVCQALLVNPFNPDPKKPVVPDPPPCNGMGIPLPHNGSSTLIASKNKLYNPGDYRCPRCMDTNLFNRVQYSTKDEVTCTAIVGKPGFSHECGYVGPIAHFRVDYQPQTSPSEEVAEPKPRDTDESLRKQRDDNLRSIFG